VTWKSTSAKTKVPTARERAVAAKLRQVEMERQPFEQLSRRIVLDTLARCHLPEGPIIEIGAGDGQLRRRLPESVVQRLIATEPDPAVSRLFRVRHPGVQLIAAPAERLPFETASVAAVVGLCVMDVVPAREVIRELARVLKPGGCFVHWLDMSTVLESMIDVLRQAELVSFPNFFSDPSAREWPEDLYLVSRHALEIVIRLLSEAGIPLARPLGEYLTTFCSGSIAAATTELIRLQENTNLRRALSAAFGAAILAAPPAVRAKLATFRAQPFSTARDFDARMREWFEQQAAFAVESSIVRAWEVQPRIASEIAYRSCLMGEQRHLSYLPQPLLCADATCASESDRVVELGMLTLIATRRQD
jgi:SAM-dependent methyltransferase